MKVLSVLVERGARALDRPFSYCYLGGRDLKPYVRLRVLFGNKPLVGFLSAIEETEESLEEVSDRLGFKVRAVKDEDFLDEEPILGDALISLARRISDYYMAPLVSVLQAMLPPSLSPRSGGKVGIRYEKRLELLDPSEEGLTPKQVELLRLLAHGSVPRRSCSPSVLDALVRKGRARLVSVEVLRRKPFLGEKEERKELLPAQRKAYEEILSSGKNVHLLQGVTGSGKTEIYLHLSEHYLGQGRNVLMLVPEINLTPRMVEYFERRFGDKVAVLHSGLSAGERYDAYRRIKRGEAPIVIGARSAVFAPLPSIGLIILDEEHVESYKQEGSPHYHAREVAVWRGEMEGAKVLLGTATPSLETKTRALRGVYGLTVLSERVGGLPLPKARIIDMRTPGFATGKEGRRKISPPLEEAMRKVLSEGKQALLLLNRRGYWVGVECPSCGYFFSCPQCGSSLAYHREDNLLKCHHCGHVELYPERCPQCGRTGFRRVGYGTERLEEECLRLFPGARTGRLDSDVTVSRERMEKVLQDFREHRLDILVGTQMIAKGHDFPEVALSALVDADIGLQVPGYRSAERVFNLVCQTIGRAGRALAPGSAYVQTFNPSSSAIRFGALQDYEGFYEAEMRRRKEAGEPPYRYLLLLTYLSDKEGKALEAAARTKERLLKEGFPRFRALGPIDPYYQDHGRERKGLLLSFFDPEPVKKAVKDIADSFLPLGVDYDVDVDPLDS